MLSHLFLSFPPVPLQLSKQSPGYDHLQWRPASPGLESLENDIGNLNWPHKYVYVTKLLYSFVKFPKGLATNSGWQWRYVDIMWPPQNLSILTARPEEDLHVSKELARFLPVPLPWDTKLSMMKASVGSAIPNCQMVFLDDLSQRISYKPSFDLWTLDHALNNNKNPNMCIHCDHR